MPTVLEPELVDADAAAPSARWMAVIFNDDVTPYELVVLTIMTATGCDEEEAQIETWEAHHRGSAPIHFASEAECERVARVMRRIRVKTEVRREWA